MNNPGSKPFIAAVQTPCFCLKSTHGHGPPRFSLAEEGRPQSVQVAHTRVYRRDCPQRNAVVSAASMIQYILYIYFEYVNISVLVAC